MFARLQRREQAVADSVHRSEMLGARRDPEEVALGHAATLGPGNSRWMS